MRGQILLRINGGSSDTELKLLAVMPRGLPSRLQQVITVTPVANLPRQRRNARRSCIAESPSFVFLSTLDNPGNSLIY